MTTPGDAPRLSYDRGLKRAKYESARVPWYLLAEPDKSGHQSVALHLYRLDGRHYVEHASARHGQRLASAEPFPINVDTTELFEA